MEINIPIFRAKKLDSDEYVFGVPRQDSKGAYEMIINVVEDGVPGVIQRYIEIDTISIHFPDMIDSQGNKIFASLSEDGKGGDIIETELKRVCTTKYKEYFFYADNKDYHCNCFGFIHSKIIGIQQ